MRQLPSRRRRTCWSAILMATTIGTLLDEPLFYAGTGCQKTCGRFSVCENRSVLAGSRARNEPTAAQP